MNPKYKEQAIPLISVDPNTGKYILTQQGQDFIRSVPGPIGVVSVAGLYRTGKSYLLNRMILNRSNGFGVGPTVNPCTKGLWCWGTPIKGESVQGQKLNILVIDTQGIGALDQDQTHDTRIFTLAILASSCFIYNSTGSIDENAVQNLSLVVNLTKHIQINTENTDEDDPDKIANYFPKFFWVVRDFSLQMVDDQGNQMNSREYLQKALAPQKGMSEDIQEKNRIRKILTSFFKERQCITLVRPLIDETKLQELDTIEFDSLRPQFANKVMQLRKCITKKMKPKTLNSQKLNGQLYCSMLTSYVGAINNGAVPNIQNAWHYMCQQQCTKILNQSYDVFQKAIKDIRIPCSVEQIQSDLQKAQETAIQFFKKQSIGEEADKYYRELIQKIKSRSSKLKSVNIEEGKTAFKKYISPSMNLITQKINKQEYDNIESFIEEVQKFEQKLTKQQPKFANWQLYLQLSTKKMLQQGSLYFIRKARNQKEQLMKTSEQKIKINEKQLNGLKTEKQAQEKKTLQQIVNLQKEKIDLSRKIENLEFEIQNTTKDKSDEVSRLSKSLTNKKKQLEEYQEDYQKKLKDALNKLTNTEEQMYNKAAEWQKERAVMQKQLQQNKQWINQLQKKKQSFDANYAKQQAQLYEKYEQKLLNEKNRVEQLSNELNKHKQQNQSLSKDLKQVTQRFEEARQKYESEQIKYKEQITSKRMQLQKMINEKQLEKNKFKNQFEQQQQEINRDKQDLETKLKKSQLRSKQMKTELTNQNMKLTNQLAVLTQKCQQLNQQNQQTRQKISEMKRRHADEREAWEADKGMYQQEQMAKKINQMNAYHAKQKEELINDHERQMKKLTQEINILTTANNQYQINMKVLKDNLSKQKLNNDQTQQQVKRELDDTIKRMKNLERDLKSELQSKDMDYKHILSEKQAEFDDEKERLIAQKLEFERKLRSEMMTIKSMHESQKCKLDQKKSQEIDKLRKQLREQRKNFDETLSSEKQQLEQEKQYIQFQLSEEIKTLQSTIDALAMQKDQIAKEKSILEERTQNKIRDLQKSLIDQATKMQQQIQTIKVDKNKIEDKYNEIFQAKLQSDKQMLALNHAKQNLAKDNAKQEDMIKQLEASNSKLKSSYDNYKNQAQYKIKEITNSSNLYKSQKQKQLALLSQQKIFLENKKNELQKDYQDKMNNLQIETKRIKETTQAQKKLIEDKLNDSRRNYEEKIEKLKKQKIQIQSTFYKKISTADKQNAVLTEKVKFLQNNLNESNQKHAEQLKSISEQLIHEKTIRKTQNQQNRNTIQKMQDQLTLKQNQFAKIRGQLQVTIKLHQNQIGNLNHRLEQQKNDNAENYRILERNFEEYKKKSDQEKNSKEMNHQQYRNMMELRNQSECTKLKQNIREKQKQLDIQKKEKQKIAKQLSEKLAFLAQQKQNIQKRLKTMEAQLKAQIFKKQEQTIKYKEQHKRQKHDMMSEIKILRQKQKNKIEDYDRKLKSAQDIKNNTIFEKQKQQVKWNMEKMGFQQKISQLKDMIEKLNNDNTKLTQQNQNFKAEKRKGNSQIAIKDRTFIYAREIPTENKQNTNHQ